MINNFVTWLNENQQLRSKEDIEKWLIYHEIKNYTINDDLTVDVKDNVILEYQNFEYFPVKFNKVGGNFNCYNCVNLMTLEGAPLEVGEDFSCAYSVRLTSLKGASVEISIAMIAQV